MGKVIAAIKSVLIFFLLGIIGWFFFNYYSVIFSKKVIGVVTKVERVEMPVALMSNASSEVTSKVFSFAIGIKDHQTGEIFTSSSEDRQWAVAESGLCAEAEFLPYAPWTLEKKGTYFGARLLKLYECDKEAAQ